MPKKFFVYSKLATDMIYSEKIPGGADMYAHGRRVFIKGGAGVANKNLITPLGVRTEITEEEMDVLNSDGVFQLHKKNGFVMVESKSYDVEKVVANMTSEPDKSAPLTPADYEGSDVKPVKK